MGNRAIIQALLLLVWALLPALQAGMSAAPRCVETAKCCGCCGGGACHCAKTPERLPDRESQPLLPIDSNKQVSPPAVPTAGEVRFVLAGALAGLRLPVPATQAVLAACPVPARLLYCRFLI